MSFAFKSSSDSNSPTPDHGTSHTAAALRIEYICVALPEYFLHAWECVCIVLHTPCVIPMTPQQHSSGYSRHWVILSRIHTPSLRWWCIFWFNSVLPTNGVWKKHEVENPLSFGFFYVHILSAPRASHDLTSLRSVIWRPRTRTAAARQVSKAQKPDLVTKNNV